MIWVRIPRIPGKTTYWIGCHDLDGPDVCYIHRWKYDFELHQRVDTYCYVLGWRDGRHSQRFATLTEAKQRAEKSERAKVARQTQEVD